MKNRRDFLKTCLAGAGTLAAHHALGQTGHSRWPLFDSEFEPGDPWLEVPRILARIKPPVFPKKDFDITKFGAVGNNKTDNTEAFKKAVAECSKAGGGRVVVPKGEFLTGAIELQSNVNLHVVKDGTVRFTHDTKKYPLVFTRWEGMELMNYSPFIYAFEKENIAITGEGTIDGNSDCTYWWPWKGRTNCGWKKGDPEQTADRNKLFEMAEKGVPVSERIFGEGHLLRPQFIQPYRCKNVLIEGVTLLQSPMWQVHPVLCQNVTVRGLTINCSILGPNTDGCDPESCKDVLIQDVNFNVGDDCIAIKAGRNADGRRLNVPSENIVIQGCHMQNGHGGVTVGSEISGGVRNVFAQDCKMDSPSLDMAIRIKNNAMRGGVLENIYVRNIEVGEVAFAGLSIDFYYEEGEAGKFTPITRNVDIRKVTLNKAQYAIYLRGFKNAPIENVHVSDCDFKDVQKPNVTENVKGLVLNNVTVNGKVM